MKIRTGKDGKGQPYIEWEQWPDVYKRAWIQKKDPQDYQKNWARVPDGRYLNVVRLNDKDNPGGNATDFPIFENCRSDEDFLQDFVAVMTALTGSYKAVTVEKAADAND